MTIHKLTPRKVATTGPGKYKDVGLDEARDKATEYSKQAKGGIDPIEARPTEPEKVPTFYFLLLCLLSLPFMVGAEDTTGESPKDDGNYLSNFTNLANCNSQGRDVLLLNDYHGHHSVTDSAGYTWFMSQFGDISSLKHDRCKQSHIKCVYYYEFYKEKCTKHQDNWCWGMICNALIKSINREYL
ncbi:MAG: Arm DNA-binding domain-containing protein [Candidatus Thiodiazotropha sp. (ex Lucinoma aequizonata)]|nr:Arm DNA-binding domain-containing protein [Candidatus Thiodiazotropha sp. (ex Lucinoma aequizonata)]